MARGWCLCRCFLRWDDKEVVLSALQQTRDAGVMPGIITAFLSPVEFIGKVAPEDSDRQALLYWGGST